MKPRTFVLVTLLAVSSLCAGLLAAWGAAHPGVSRPDTLAEGLRELEPFVGYRWEIETQWLDGTPLKGVNEYRAVMGGQFVEARTWASAPDGSMYQRYTTLFAYDKQSDTIRTFGFNHDGTTTQAQVAIANDPAGGYPLLRSWWIADFGGQRVEIRQEVQMKDAESYAWKVWSAEPGSGTLNPMMNATWRRAARLTD